MTNKDEYPDRFISEKETARLLSVSVPTLQRMPDPPRLQVGVRRIAYRLSDVMRKIESAVPKKSAGSLVILLLIAGARVFVGGPSDPDAAGAIERLVREHFEEKGEILPRFGQAPKRSILFRTDAPFKKIKIVFGEPGTPERDCEKLEFMCDGQQLVIDGIHPGTGRPYLWHGGKPGSTKREELPYIHAEEAKELIETCAALLVNDFGYKHLKAKAKAKKPNGEDTKPTDWTVDFSDHDSLAAFVMKMISGGTNPGLVFNFCRAQIEAHVPDPERKQRRLNELRGMVDSAVAKIEEPQQPKFEPTTLAQVVATFDKWLVLRDHMPIYAVLGVILSGSESSRRRLRRKPKF
jgi:hypothetical protein